MDVLHGFSLCCADDVKYGEGFAFRLALNHEADIDVVKQDDPRAPEPIGLHAPIGGDGAREALGDVAGDRDRLPGQESMLLQSVANPREIGVDQDMRDILTAAFG